MIRPASPDPAPCGVIRGGIRVGALTLALAATLAASAPAATYYVDNQSPGASPAGPGTEISPYNTISAAVAARKGPGITITVKPGVYREQVTVPASGAAGNPYILRASGPGVVIDGSDDYSNPALWTTGMPVPGGGSHGMACIVDGLWLAAGVGSDVHQVFVDGMHLTPSTAAPGALPVNAFTWVAGEGLYVNLGSNNPGAHQTLVGRRSNGFNLFTKSWVTIDGFEVRYTEERAINIQNGCTDLVISNNRVRFAGDYGIRTVNGIRIRIDGNVISDCQGHGIGLTAGASGCIVRNNECFRSAKPHIRFANGIYLFGAPDNVLVGNNCHENDDTGIQLNSGSTNCILTNNRSWNNGDHGFDHYNVSGTIHVNDVASRNYRDGFSVEGDSPNTQIFNCIAVENGLTTNEFNLWVNSPSTVGFVSDHNLFWNSTTQPPFKYVATKYLTLAGYQAASGQDAHSIQANPMFVDLPAGNFLPMHGSPAIDAGASDVSNWPAIDAVGNPRVDDVSTPDHGSGPISYSDIGALEYVQGSDAGPVALSGPLGPIVDKRSPRMSGTPATSEETSATAFSLSSGFPNPSRGNVDFALDLPADAQVRWEVFDLQGRVVWSEQRSFAAGRAVMTWDGRNAAGQPAGTGIYMIRAQVGARQFTRRVIQF